MTGKYKVYPEYKKSGVEWLGNIPTSWKVLPIKKISEILNGATPKSIDSDYWNGDIPWITPADLGKSNSPYIGEGSRSITLAGYESCGTTLVPKGAVILSSRAPIGTLGITTGKLCTNQGCKSLIIKNKNNNKYIYYVLLSSTVQLNLLGRGTTFLELSSDELGSYKVGLPPEAEQKIIAEFLDHETAKIDTLIEKQQQLIQLLKEKRQSVISHAVTKGLTPNAKMRDSGIEWLGAVPEHWRVVALKHLVSAPIIDGPHLTPAKQDEGVPFISAEAISQGYINFDKRWGYISRRDHEIYSRRYRPQKGDILMVKLGATTGVVAMVETDDEFNVWVPLATIRVHKEVSSRFIFYLLQSCRVRDAIQLSWTFGTQQTLGLGTLANLYMPIPSLKEAEEIVALIESKIPLYDESVKNCEVSLQLLVERRTALISAAVTGKIDVRNWVAPQASQTNKEVAA